MQMVKVGIYETFNTLVYVPAPNVVDVLLTAILCFSAFTF